MNKMAQIDKNSIKDYLEKRFGGKVSRIEIAPLGRGVLGTGYLLEFEIGSEKYRKVLKSLFTEHMGKEYAADRAQSLILAHSTYGLMDNHVRSNDVVGIEETGRIVSVGNAEEFFIIMDEARGTDYFSDIVRIARSNRLEETDKNKAIILAEFLAKLHKDKFKKESLYKRKIRDTIGSGESIMGVMDMYPEKLDYFPKETQIKIVQKAVECWMRDKFRGDRLCRVHGDFHPGNVWFKDSENFTLLDRARGEYGEAADDITALLINFIFYSLIYKGKFGGALADLLNIFVGRYFHLSNDKGMEEVIAPYWAFRAAVLCNPYFYSDEFFKGGLKADVVRREIINFALNALRAERFDWKRINEYIGQ